MATVLLSPVGNGQQFFDNNGVPLSGGLIYTYQAGSSTPLTTYTTNNGTIPNTNPIILDAAGRCPNEIWLQFGYSYKFVLQTSAGLTLQTLDNLYPILQTSAATVDPFIVGMIMLWSGSIGSIPAGWALCNGSNGTPDLRDRFVVAAGSTYAVGATGGSADAIVVTHNHTATVTDPGHTHILQDSGSRRITAPGGGGIGGISNTPAAAPQNTDFMVNTTVTTGVTVANASAGSSGTNANLPPYYALAYIIKT
jgi:microcystin-dependent protein